MNVSDINYKLPEEKIAKFPPKIRGKSKLLHLKRSTGEILHKNYEDLWELLGAGDVLILNDSKVVKARIKAKFKNKPIEIFLVEKHSNEKQNEFFILKNKKLKVGNKLKIGTNQIEIVEAFDNGTFRVVTNVDLYDLSNSFGTMPIPPYLNRESNQLDEERYQTVFAKQEGSVAAPTASLNFTDELKERLIQKGIIIKYLTLHVGLGTFKPIYYDDLSTHKMHEEFYVIPKDTIVEIKKAKGENRNIVALGTTVTRTLEHAHEIFSENYEIKGDSYTNEADIFIYPGYEFKIIDKLITNFHAPSSTVLMLAAAFAGVKNLKQAYKVALENDYRFLSYGDSMIIE